MKKRIYLLAIIIFTLIGCRDGGEPESAMPIESTLATEVENSAFSLPKDTIDECLLSEITPKALEDEEPVAKDESILLVADWTYAYANLIENIDERERVNFQKFILLDVDFDGIPELFLTLNSITQGERHWIYRGFTYKNGSIIDIKCNYVPINLELYRHKETGELRWIGDGVDYYFISDEIIEHEYTYYLREIDFSDISETVEIDLIVWQEEYTSIWGEENSQSESILTLITYFGLNPINVTSKNEIDYLHKEILLNYEHLDTIRVIGDAQIFKWVTGDINLVRDKLLALLYSYEKQKNVIPQMWKQLYLDEIDTLMEEYPNIRDYECFSLLYINDDDVPELEFTPPGRSGSTIYTVSNDKLESFSSGFIEYYIERQNLFYNRYRLSDGSWDEICCIKNGMFSVVHKGEINPQSYNVEGTPIRDATGEVIYVYIWDEAEVSASEYNEKLALVFDEAKAIPLYLNRKTEKEIVELINRIE